MDSYSYFRSKRRRQRRTMSSAATDQNGFPSPGQMARERARVRENEFAEILTELRQLMQKAEPENEHGAVIVRAPKGLTTGGDINFKGRYWTPFKQALADAGWTADHGRFRQRCGRWRLLGFRLQFGGKVAHQRTFRERTNATKRMLRSPDYRSVVYGSVEGQPQTHKEKEHTEVNRNRTYLIGPQLDGKTIGGAQSTTHGLPTQPGTTSSAYPASNSCCGSYAATATITITITSLPPPPSPSP